MYKQIENLVKKKKLKFNCQHTTNLKSTLEDNEELFLKMVERKTHWSENEIDDIYCFDCDEHLSYRLEGSTLVPDTMSCFKQDEVVLEIDVPSGELIIDDWLTHAKDVLDDLSDRSVSVNSTKGLVKRTTDFANGEVAFFYVGNSCPSVYQKGNKLLIGRGEYDETEDMHRPLEKGADEKGSVCTDLWWVTISDFKIYKEKAISKYGEEKGRKMAAEARENADIVLSVEPGTYTLRYFTDVGYDATLYATLEKK